MDISIYKWKQCSPLLELLKGCAKKKDLSKGSKLHAHILNRGLHKKNPYVASSLINMYAKCGVLENAQQVLEELPTRDVVSWSALIAGYAQHSRGHDALDCFSRMQREGISPNAITFISILKACGSIGAIEKGKQIHDEIVNKGLLSKNIVLANALVDMYAKCGLVAKARDVFDDLPTRNVVTWNTVIAGYTQHEQPHKALDCFVRMQREGFSPSVATYASILKVCGNIGAIDKGIQIHDEIIGKGLLNHNIALGNALVNMYAKCGLLSRAHKVHEELANRDVVSWNALITGYNQEGKGHEALGCFEGMEREGISPNDVTFICILKACGSIQAIEKGEQIHDEIVNRGLLEKNIMIGNALMDMYVKCGALGKAQQVLHMLPVRDIVTWSTLISGYTQDGRAHEALNCFIQMQKDGLSPNEVTFISVLKACGSIGAIDKGKHIHKEIVGRGYLKQNMMLGNALVDMYVKCGELAKAQQVVEELDVRSVVSWNILIAGYTQEEQGHKALACFALMQREGLTPNEVTFTCILNACGSIGAIDKGKQIHNLIVGGRLMDDNVVLGTALMDMYAKCGVLAKAQQVLEELPLRNVVSWSALIAGYALEGRCHEAIDCFEQMEREGLSPNEITFLCLLNAFSHSGKSDEAQMYYENMKKTYGIKPNLEHDTCMVLAFGFSGQFDKAMSVISTIQSSSKDASLWLALLSTCRKWGNVKLGRLAFDQAIQLDNQLAASYTLMADIYGAAGLLEDAQKVEAMRVKSVVARNAC